MASELIDFRDELGSTKEDEAVDFLLDTRAEGGRRFKYKGYSMREWLYTELGPEAKSEIASLTRDELAEKVVDVVYGDAAANSEDGDDNEPDEAAPPAKDKKAKRSRASKKAETPEETEDGDENESEEAAPPEEGKKAKRRRSRKSAEDTEEKPATRRTRRSSKKTETEIPTEKLQEPNGAPPAELDLTAILDTLNPLLDFVSVAGKKIDKIEKMLKELATKEDLEGLGTQLDELHEDIFVVSALTEEALVSEGPLDSKDVDDLIEEAIERFKEDDNSGN